MLKTHKIEQQKIIECAEDSANIFIYINPTDAEKRLLIDTLQIDEHTLNSALDPDELPRLEFEPNHHAIIFNRPKNYTGQAKLLFKVASTGVFLFVNKLIIVQTEDSPLFEGKHFLKISSFNDLVLKIIYRSIFHFLEHLKVINMISDDLEKKVNHAMDNGHLIHLFTLGKSLVYYVNAIHSNGMLIEKLKHNAHKIGFTADEMEFLDDTLIENNQCARQAEIYSNILASLMDARASIVSNNLNVLMKTLNLITIGIMVPTLVVSAFSMNVKIPLSGHPHAFYGILGLALCSVVLLVINWKRKKW
ncbi:MAG: magnesium transporter CorA family protein [Deltaproteobacteria bacterium]|nr:magnesium transporter CorA family protein [Deltaproteobacteria bacterium]